VARRIRQAGLLAGLAALTALACGSDTISLLPVPNPGGGSAGESTSAGSGGSEATPNAGRSNEGGSRNGSGAGRGGNGNAGGSVDGGSASSFGGSLCNGQSCAGGSPGTGNANGFGGGTCIAGIDNCTPCETDAQCPMDMRCGSSSKQTKNKCVTCVEDSDCDHGLRCDVPIGRCAPPCRSSEDCGPDKLCDTTFGVCVQCASQNDCERIRPDLQACHMHRCFECEYADDCTGPGLGFCIGYRCIECFTKEDCGGRPCFDNKCR
jgi:hypothetical protein